jgi:putative SOS response-associated peptidase YedK
MCGRFAQNLPPDELRKTFVTRNPLLNQKPSWNVAPTQGALVVRWNRKTDERSLDQLRWGLVPMWATDLSIGSRQINARAETLGERPAYRDAYAKRRCLVPVTAFYEWRTLESGAKQAYAIGAPDGSPLVLGGLWERWRDKAGEITRSFTIVTVPANEQIKPLHERMPLILEQKDWSAWLGETAGEVASLLKPYDGELRLWPISSRVNSPANDDAGLLDPMPDRTPA